MLRFGEVSPDTIVTVISILAGFAANIFFSGRYVGRIEADLKNMREDMAGFRAKDFITRSEYENRHAEMIEMVVRTRAPWDKYPR